MRCISLIQLVISLLPNLLLAVPTRAAPMTVEGITFSDERGSFTIRGVTGTGSLTDPFVVVEDVTGLEPMLIIRLPGAGLDNRIGTRDPMGMAIVKVVINHSGTTWYGFRIEPREAPEWSSPDSDGLSLGQGWSARPPIASNAFRHVQIADQPQDALDFDDGQIEEGQTLVFNFFLTDSTWQSEIFVLQAPKTNIACTWPRQTGVC